MYNIEWYCNPLGTPKDPSDYSRMYGLEEFVKLIKQNLNI